MNTDLLAQTPNSSGALYHGLPRRGVPRFKIALGALLLALLLTLAPVWADAALHTALVPVALADGPQSGDGG